jgi:hypothetical protein
MDYGKELLKIVEKNVDVPTLVEDALNIIIKPALDDLVKESSTPLDDVAMNTIYPMLAPAIIKQVKLLWEKLDGQA